MPRKFKSPCLRCYRNVSETTYCDECQPKIDKANAQAERKYQKTRKTPKQEGYPRNWNLISKMYRNRHPLCEFKVNGKPCTNSTAMVHHVDGDPSNNPSDWSNYMSACVSCHEKHHRGTRWKKGGAKPYVG